VTIYLRSVNPDCQWQFEYYGYRKIINWKKWWCFVMLLFFVTIYN